MNSVHHVVPGDIDFLELLSFNWHLVDDIFRGEDWLKIHPDGLDFEPHIEVILGSEQDRLPLDNFIKHELSQVGDNYTQ